MTIRPDKYSLARAGERRKNLTEAEKRLWGEIRAKQLGVKFRRQVPVGSYIVDFLSHAANLVIEVDEDHAAGNEKAALLNDEGFRVVYLSGDEIFQNMDGVLAHLEMAIKAGLHASLNAHPHPIPPSHAEEGTSATSMPKPSLPRKGGRGRVGAVLKGGQTSAPIDTVTLSYDDRFRRRMAMTGDMGTAFILDLPQAMELFHGDDLCLDGGGYIRVIAAPEDLMMVETGNLARIAWHIGNRHLPCEIQTAQIILRWDHVIAEMLEKLGCSVHRITAAFNPEGGAYGQGRPQGHSHSGGHSDSHTQSHFHAHHETEDPT